MLNDAQVLDLLRNTRTIALVGASSKPDRASFGVMRYLLNAGYRVIPINPGFAGQEILGQPVVGRLADIKEPVDLVNVFREPGAASGLVDEAVAIGAKAFWLQLGLTSAEAARKAGAAHLPYVEDRCSKIEHMQLRG